jgi:hypothetical protein
MPVLAKAIRTYSLPLMFLVALAGCVSSVDEGSRSQVEGYWSDLGNVATTKFRGGLVATNSNDTGFRLSDGTYKQSGIRDIQIELYSHVRNRQVRINCTLVSQNRMNCTTHTGSRFVLNRKSAIS